MTITGSNTNLQTGSYVYPPPISITPNSGTQGTSFPMSITGNNTSWQSGPYAFSLTVGFSGSGVTATGAVILTNSTATADVSIDASATVGSRSVSFDFNNSHGDDYTITIDSGFTVMAILPVELTSFTPSAIGSTVELQWTTATEINNYGFDIERNVNNSWSKIGFLAGNGTSNAPHNYSYTDNVGSAGTYSYRLQQIDHDGAFTYSQEVEVTIQPPKVFSLAQNYPDPFNPSTTIQFTVPNDGRATLKVYNTLGQEVAILFDGVATASQYNQATFNASSLASGIYFSRLEFGGKMQVKKMLLLK